MHLHKQYTCSLMTTLPQAKVLLLRFAVGILWGRDATMFTHLLQTQSQTLHLSSPLGTQMKCHNSDSAMFLAVSCGTWCFSVSCLSACPAKSYIQRWSGWSTFSHFQKRGCECTSKIFNLFFIKIVTARLFEFNHFF